MIEKDEQYQKLKDYAFRLLSIRPRSAHELEEKVYVYAKKRKFPQTWTHTLIEELTQKKYLNDSEFAAWYKGQRELHNPRSKRVISLELKQKGIKDDLIDSIFSDDSSDQNDLEYEKAVKIASKRIKFYTGTKGFELKRKLSAYLYQKGYPWEIISRVVDSLVKK
jgi:regulatory protein